MKSMASYLKVALLQIDIFWLDIDANLARLEEYFYDNIIGEGFDIIVLPEMFNTGFGKNAAGHAEFMNGKSHKWLKNMAMLSDALMLGSFSVKDNGMIFNRLMAVYPDGRTLFYDKKHLFSYGEEHLVFSSGERALLLQYKGFIIKPLICYDLRFPVWSRNSVSEPFDVLIYVANWPDSRKYAWEQLLKARAIENQCYVLGCNRIGVDGNNLQYGGGSAIIDHEGKYLALAKENEALVVATLDKSSLQKFRVDFPFLNDSDKFQFVS
jgi:predicted amidohydrolase